MLCSVYELSVATECCIIVNLLMRKTIQLFLKHQAYMLKKLIVILMPSFAMDVKDEGGFQRQRNAHSELGLLYESRFV